MTTRTCSADWGQRSQASAKPIQARAGFRINHAVAVKVYDRRRPGRLCGYLDPSQGVYQWGGDLLIFNSERDFDADAAILVSPHGSERDPYSGTHPRHWRRSVVVKGFVTREEFLERAVERDLGYGQRLVMRDGQLRPLRELLEPEPVAVQQLALV